MGTAELIFFGRRIRKMRNIRVYFQNILQLLLYLTFSTKKDDGWLYSKSFSIKNRPHVSLTNF